MRKRYIFLILISLIILVFIILIAVKKLNESIEEEEEESFVASTGIDETEEENIVKKDTSKTTLSMLLKWVNIDNNYCYIKEVYNLINEDICEYFIYGIQNNSDKFFVAYIDQTNETYLLEELDSNEYDKIKNNQINSNFLKPKTIEKNSKNEYSFELMTDRKIAVLYFDIIKNLIDYEPEVLYDILDTEYRQKKFTNVQEFKEYINSNENRFSTMEIDKYANYKYDDYLQYVCLDTEGNYYIINEDVQTGDYTIFLDTYTVDQPEFIEKYEKATNEQKAGYDINKFVEAINDKDYTYAYSCLAESFKQNNFKTINDFEIYIKNNFVNNNELEYIKAYKEGQYYVYETNIINKDNSSVIAQKNFIVNLKEERNFELSFNI